MKETSEWVFLFYFPPPPLVIFYFYGFTLALSPVYTQLGAVSPYFCLAENISSLPYRPWPLLKNTSSEIGIFLFRGWMDAALPGKAVKKIFSENGYCCCRLEPISFIVPPQILSRRHSSFTFSGLLKSHPSLQNMAQLPTPSPSSD